MAHNSGIQTPVRLMLRRTSHTNQGAHQQPPALRFPQLQQNTWGAAPAVAWAACSGSSSTHTSWLLPWLPRQHPQKGGDALEHLALNRCVETRGMSEGISQGMSPPRLTLPCCQAWAPASPQQAQTPAYDQGWMSFCLVCREKRGKKRRKKKKKAAKFNKWTSFVLLLFFFFFFCMLRANL